jgi:hypothetical protein
MKGIVVNPLYANWSHEYPSEFCMDPVAVGFWDGEQAIVLCDSSPKTEADIIIRHHTKEKVVDYLTNAAFDGTRIIQPDARLFPYVPKWIELRGVDAKNAIPLLSKTTLDLTVEIGNLGAHRATLNDAIRETLGEDRALRQQVSPATWVKTSRGKLIDENIEDAKTIYDLWKFGTTKGFIRLRSRVTGEIEQVRVDW